MSMATACTTGTHAVGLGYRSIVYGEADLAVVGGSEAPVNPLAVAGFIAVRALSERNDEPGKSKPPVGPKTATALFLAKEPVSWCLKTTNAPKNAAPRFMPRSPDLA